VQIKTIIIGRVANIEDKFIRSLPKATTNSKDVPRPTKPIRKPANIDTNNTTKKVLALYGKSTLGPFFFNPIGLAAFSFISGREGKLSPYLRIMGLAEFFAL
jgi:hypothetical protein